MPTSNFDIFETDDGYLAVTNEVRRTIVRALAEEELQLPDLVELTGKSKSTLSSVHLKELMDQGIVEPVAHPSDKRKKIFRLKGTRIGSSSVPLEQLREAVKEYVSVAPMAARFPLAITFDSLAAAPADTEDTIIWDQARRLGLLVGGLLEAHAGRQLLMEVADLAEREGLATPVSLDLQQGDALVLEPGGRFASANAAARLPMLMGGFLEGMLASKNGDGVRVDVDQVEEGGQFTLRVHR